MFPRLAADAVLLFHLAFIVFAVAGALFAAKWRWVPLLQFPAAAWGFFVECTGRDCPLTRLEDYLRVRAGQAGYGGDFIGHYLLAVIYPSGLTREIQFILAAIVLVMNISIYAWLILRRQAQHKADG